MLEDVRAGHNLPSNLEFNELYLRQLSREGEQFRTASVESKIMCPICTRDTSVGDMGVMLDSQGRGCGCKACVDCIKGWLQTDGVADQLHVGHLRCFLAGAVGLCCQPDDNVLEIAPSLLD